MAKFIEVHPCNEKGFTKNPEYTEYINADHIVMMGDGGNSRFINLITFEQSLFVLDTIEELLEKCSK